MRVALLFPGQGSQEVGMGRELYESSSAARTIFEQAAKIVPHLTDVIFNGPAEKLTATAFCQPAIFTFSVAAFKALSLHPKYKDIEPAFTCGLSLGEYSALCACEALPFTEALRLVERRSFFMEEAAKLKVGSMAAVIGFDQVKLIAICKETGAEVANFNSPEQIVITGEAPKVELASRLIKEQGGKRVIPLNVGGAFHSSLMLPAAVKFEGELAQVQVKKPLFPILSNVDAKPTQDPALIKVNLARQITSSVLWMSSVETIAREGVTHFIEIGPGTILKGLIRKIDPQLKVINIQKPSDIDAMPF